jgi:cytidine deaminase
LLDVRDLVKAAVGARTNAYAPYSVYRVGAAVLGADGRIRSGCNVENVAFGLSLCAERSAVARMVGDGCLEVRAVAVATKDGGTPCGACLQTLLEFSPEPAAVEVVCVDEDGREATYRLDELIPHGFRTELKKT